MKCVTYTCDRCGATSSVEMLKFKCEFGRAFLQDNALPGVITGHLCRRCEGDWCNEFFNRMVYFMKGKA